MYYCANPKHCNTVKRHYHQTRAQRFLCYRRGEDSLIPSVQEEEMKEEWEWDVLADHQADIDYAKWRESMAEAGGWFGYGD